MVSLLGVTEARQRLDRAVELERGVLREVPAFANAREYLRNHLTVRGTALARMGRGRDLLAGVDELAAMDQDPSAQRTAARHLLRLAKLRERTSVDAAGDLPSPATCHERALELLVRAERLGWVANDALRDELYAPLREHPGFAALCQRVEARRPPTAPGSTK